MSAGAGIAAGHAAAGPASAGMGPIILLVAFVAIFYFMLIRPQTKRRKEQQAMLSKLSKGDEVVTIGGLIGKINKISDDFISVNIADGVDVKLQKPSISSVLPKGTLKSIN